MNATLKSLAHVLAQVTQRPRMASPVGVWVGGAIALMMVAGHSNVAANEAGIYPVAQPAAKISEPAQRNAGRAAGAAIGALAAKAAGANKHWRVGAAVIGAVVGGEAVRAAQTENSGQAGPADTGRPQSYPPGQSFDSLPATAADKFLADRYQPTLAGLRTLSPELHSRMSTLVIEASAARMAAQELWRVFEETELLAVTDPNDRAAAARHATAREEQSRAIQMAGVGLAKLRNAYQVANQQGYDISRLEPVIRELSTYVDGRFNLAYTSPRILARSHTILRSYAGFVRDSVLSQSAQKNTAAAQPLERSRHALATP